MKFFDAFVGSAVADTLCCPVASVIRLETFLATLVQLELSQAHALAREDWTVEHLEGKK